MGGAVGKEKRTYAEIARLVRNSSAEYARLCKSHYAFIDSRFGAGNHALLSEFVQGAAMAFQGDVKNMKKAMKEGPKWKRERAMTTQAILKQLVPLMHKAPKSQRQLTLVRAHHFSTPPRVGSVFTHKLPMSTSMFHPFSVEWIASRPHDDGYKPFMLIIRVTAGTGGMLCVGCPVPHECPIEHQRTFRVGPRTNWAYEALTQHQFQNQSEVILAPAKFKVTGNGSFSLRDIHNLNRYGLGWYTNVQDKRVNQDRVVHCVFVDLLPTGSKAH